MQYTAVVRGIENRDEYVATLRLAGLPVPEFVPREDPTATITGSGSLTEGQLGTVSFGG
jgi:hypothetical protein